MTNLEIAIKARNTARSAMNTMRPQSGQWYDQERELNFWQSRVAHLEGIAKLNKKGVTK